MILSLIQQQVAAILAADPAFAGVAMVCVDKGDVGARIEEALAASSTAVLIAPPSARFAFNAGTGPMTIDGGLRISLQIIETSGLGRAAGQPSALDLAERAGWLLHSCNHPRRADDTPLGLEEIAPQPDPDILIIQITLAGTVAIDRPPHLIPEN